MVKKGFFKDIYATETTCKLLPLALADCGRILKNLSKRKCTSSLYDERDIDKTLSLLKPCKYNEPIRIGEHIKATFLSNGHLLGAALILVQISYPECNDINLLFTGDYKDKNLFFDVEPIPDWIAQLPLTVILESTYGDMDSTQIEESFRKNVIECMNYKDGIVTACTFSLGRTQEILYTLKLMQDSKELDSNIPIFLDGKLAIKYTEMYIKADLGIKPEMMNFLPKNITFVNKNNRKEVLNDNQKKIIVTSSGMGSYGPAQMYIPHFMKRKHSLIQFTGYTAEGTLGRKLKDAKTNDIVEFGGLLVQKLARVEYTTEYSAHAKANELIKLLQNLFNIKLILLNHGEYDTINNFSHRIVEEINPKNIGILGRGYFFRVDHYGLRKTLPTKFKFGKVKKRTRQVIIVKEHFIRMKCSLY